MEKIIGYKGFNKELECRDYVYDSENDLIRMELKSYKAGERYDYEFAELYKNGFHFTENLLDEFSATPPCKDGTLNRFCVIEAGGEIRRSTRGTLTASSEIVISKEIKEKNLALSALESIMRIIESGLTKSETAYVSPVVKRGALTFNNGFYSVSTDTGNHTEVERGGCSSIAANTGNESKAVTNGDFSVSAVTGGCSAAANDGNNSVAACTAGSSAASGNGRESIAAATCPFSVAITKGEFSIASGCGDSSLVSTSGESSLAAGVGNNSLASGTGKNSASVVTGIGSCAVSRGEKSVSLATGKSSSAAVDGKQSIAIATGENGKAKGTMGSWLVLTETELQNDGTSIVNEVKAFKVDGEAIKPDTYYKLVNGKAVEA